jgi:hypothetical protein
MNSSILHVEDGEYLISKILKPVQLKFDQRRKNGGREVYASNNTPHQILFLLIKSRRMRWARYVARMGEEERCLGVLVGKPDGKRPLGRSRYRWIILKWIFRKWDGEGARNGLIWLSVCTRGGHL